jgi:hypothetical protein
MSTVRVFRPAGKVRDILRAYRIIVDDEEVGKVRSGRTIEVPVEPGRHQVRAALGYVAGGDVGSEVYDLELRDGEVAELVVQPLGSPIYKPGDIGARRTSYLELVRR